MDRDTKEINKKIEENKLLKAERDIMTHPLNFTNLMKPTDDSQWKNIARNSLKQIRKNWMEKNKEKMKEACKAWRLNNRHRDIANTRFRQLRKKQRTPKWLTDDDKWLMEQAYDLAVLRTKLFGFQWDVDHIVPLNGKLVSGFHVPWNLQVIPGVHNSSKGNRV